MIDLLDCLFRTEALQIAPADSPFWYTSGTIGPYYINTEYLYGNREKADELLVLIDREKDDPVRCVSLVWDEVRKNYEAEPIYRDVMDGIVSTAREEIDLNRIDYVSGGERRDWFFSLMAGILLNRPTLAIFKDLNTLSITTDGEIRYIDRLDKKRCLHVADLVTEASSYMRGWIPAICGRGGDLTCAINVVDRDQGGEDALRDHGIEPRALLKIDPSLFETIRDRGLIDDGQLTALQAYYTDPKGTMRDFLEGHPNFQENALASGNERVAKRARLMIETNPYEIVEMKNEKWKMESAN